MWPEKHFLAGITAFIIWGFFPLALRMLVQYVPGEILYFRILFSGILLLAFVIGFKQKQLHLLKQNFPALSGRVKSRVILLTLLGGILLASNWLVFIYTVNEINIKTASFSYLICPVVTAILGVFLLGESLSVIKWISVGLCGLSCILIGSTSLRELLFSMLTAFSYAFYLITQRRNQGFDRMIGMTIQVLFALLVLSMVSSFLVQRMPQESYFYGWILTIAILFTILPLYLNLYALNKVDSATIGILMYLNPMINFVLAFTIFKEQVTSNQIVGYLMIGVSLVLFNLSAFSKLVSRKEVI